MNSAEVSALTSALWRWQVWVPISHLSRRLRWELDNQGCFKFHKKCKNLTSLLQTQDRTKVVPLRSSKHVASGPQTVVNAFINVCKTRRNWNISILTDASTLHCTLTRFYSDPSGPWPYCKKGGNISGLLLDSQLYIWHSLLGLQMFSRKPAGTETI